MLTENDLANFDKPHHLGLADFVRIKFINTIVIMKLDTKGMFWFFCHVGLSLQVT